MAPLHLYPGSDRIILAIPADDADDPTPVSIVSLYPGVPLADSVARCVATADDTTVPAHVNVATTDYVEIRFDASLDGNLHAPTPAEPEFEGVYVTPDRTGLVLWFAREGEFPEALRGSFHIGQVHPAHEGVGTFDPAEIAAGTELVLTQGA